jgi:hypothetical protein
MSYGLMGMWWGLLKGLEEFVHGLSLYGDGKILRAGARLHKASVVAEE